MSRAKSEPVGNTCPTINRAMKKIEDIINEMNSFDNESELEDILNCISNWQSTLGDIGIGNNCTLEELRDANLSLRNWGSDMKNYLEDEEQNVLELEEKVEYLEDQKEELSEEVRDLKTELKEIKCDKDYSYVN